MQMTSDSAPTPVKSESVPPPSPPAQPSASPAPNAPAAFAEEPTQQPQPVDSNAPSPDPAQPTCSNCKTQVCRPDSPGVMRYRLIRFFQCCQTTPLWRRSEDGILCNACALYQKMKVRYCLSHRSTSSSSLPPTGMSPAGCFENRHNQTPKSQQRHQKRQGRPRQRESLAKTIKICQKQHRSKQQHRQKESARRRRC